MAVAKRANIDGLYPRLFYTSMSIFASADPQLSVLTIRLVNTTLAVALLTIVFWALPRSLRPVLVVSVLATAVPLGLSLIGSTNPSSWAFLSAATTWICLYGATQTESRRRLVLAALAVVGASLGAGARADAAIFAVYAVAIALFLGLRRMRHVADLREQWAPLAAGLVAIVVSVAFYFTARQGGAALSGLDPSSARLTFAQHISNLLEIPSLWTGALGQSNLGWFDTRMPAAVWVPTTVLFAGAMFVGARAAAPRRALAIVLALVAMWAVPFVMLAQSNALVGATVQPRYLLPLLIIALGIASAREDAESAWDGVRFSLASFCLIVAGAVALHQNISRYTSGTRNNAVDPQGAWWWVGVPEPLVVWVIGSCALAGVLGLLWASKRIPSRVAFSPQGSGHPSKRFAGDGAAERP